MPRSQNYIPIFISVSIVLCSITDMFPTPTPPLSPELFTIFVRF